MIAAFFSLLFLHLFILYLIQNKDQDDDSNSDLSSGNSFEIKRVHIDVDKANIQVCFLNFVCLFLFWSSMTLPGSKP